MNRAQGFSNSNNKGARGTNKTIGDPSAKSLVDRDVEFRHSLTKAYQSIQASEPREAELLLMQLAAKGCESHELHSLLSIALKRQKRLKEALAELKKAVAKNPSNHVYWSNLCNLLREMRDYPGAIEAGLHSLTIRETSPGLSNLALAYLESGRVDKAFRSAERAIILSEDNHDAYLTASRALYVTGRADKAYEYAYKLIERGGNSIKARMNFCIATRSLGYVEKALASALEVLSITGDELLVLREIAECYTAMGMLTEATTYLERAQRLAPSDIPILCQIASSRKYRIPMESELDSQIFTEDRLLEITAEEMMQLEAARSQIMHARGMYAKAQSHLKRQLHLRANLLPSDADRIVESTEVLLEHFNDEIQPYLDYLRSDERQLGKGCVFIVGMPRSGSTLLETILSRNEDVADLGEVRLFNNAVSAIGLPKDREIADGLRKIGETYVRLVSKFQVELRKPGSIATDKMLYNYTYVGLIAAALPACKIIHCFRNPLDNILSILRANFSSGNLYCCSPADTARVLVSQAKVMSAYKQSLPGRIIDCDYDQLVSDPATYIPDVIRSLGWAWEKKYLEPEKSKRHVSTASQLQVRDPIHRSSLQGWKRYAELLAPAIPIINEAGLFGQF